jgi:hypothetical protein
MPDTREAREGRGDRRGGAAAQAREVVRTVIVETWGGWPWIGRCDDCSVQSPGQRTRHEARLWVESHLHVCHEIQT